MLLFFESVKMGYGNKKATEIICLSFPNPVWASGLGCEEVQAPPIRVARDPGCWKLYLHTHVQAQVKASTVARRALPGNDAEHCPSGVFQKMSISQTFGGKKP